MEQGETIEEQAETIAKQGETIADLEEKLSALTTKDNEQDATYLKVMQDIAQIKGEQKALSEEFLQNEASGELLKGELENLTTQVDSHDKDIDMLSGPLIDIQGNIDFDDWTAVVGKWS